MLKRFYTLLSLHVVSNANGVNSLPNHAGSQKSAGRGGAHEGN